MSLHTSPQAFFCYAATLAFGLIVSTASAAPSDTPVGTWSDGKRPRRRSDRAVRRRTVRQDSRHRSCPTEPMPTDVSGRSQCGLTILTNEMPAADGTWLGQITDPRDGNTYQAKLWLDAGGNLHLRGFIGIPLLGSTQIWRKYTGQLTAECGLA